MDNFSIDGHLVDPTFSPTNQRQVADQISWTHGKHTIRTGFELEWTQYNLVFPGLERGALIMGTFQDLLVGGPETNIGADPAAPQSNFLSCIFCVRSGPNGIIHGYRLPNRNAFVQDDWKVNPRLTMNIGVRWEYDGEISDKYGNLTDIWTSQLGPNSAIPNAPLGIAANYAGYVVPCNFNTAPLLGVLSRRESSRPAPTPSRTMCRGATSPHALARRIRSTASWYSGLAPEFFIIALV